LDPDVAPASAGLLRKLKPSTCQFDVHFLDRVITCRACEALKLGSTLKAVLGLFAHDPYRRAPENGALPRKRRRPKSGAKQSGMKLRSILGRPAPLEQPQILLGPLAP